jgi:hypothetical protein
MGWQTLTTAHQPAMDEAGLRLPAHLPTRLPSCRPTPARSWVLIASCGLLLALTFGATPAFAHDVEAGDKGYIQDISGVAFWPFVYLGAKHMVTGYDHLLFLLGVIFFLYRMKDIAVYVTLFAVGHSVTMVGGVLADIRVNVYLIDAIIGLSVAYKALDNMGAYQRWFGVQPDTRMATLIFGLFHGLGLASKLQDFDMAADGLLANLIAFNIGVEVGQLLSLGVILIAISFWRRTPGFWRHAYLANVILLSLGFSLAGYQLAGLFLA